jgi:RalA-binding protein 1
MQKSMDADAIEEAIDFTLRKPVEEEEERKIANETEISTQESENARKISTTTTAENIDKVFVAENGLFMLPKEHPDHETLIRLQLENQELMNWKQTLQMRINAERAECVRLKKIWDAQIQSQVNNCEDQSNLTPDDPEYARLVEHYLKENALLEQKRLLLSKEIVDENLSLIQLQVELAMKHLIH